MLPTNKLDVHLKLMINIYPTMLGMDNKNSPEKIS